MWHKTLVYFGLAEDERWYDDDDEDGAVANDDLERNYRERPNVRRLDRRRGRGDVEVEDIFPDEPAPRRRGGQTLRGWSSDRGAAASRGRVHHPWDRWRPLEGASDRAAHASMTPSRSRIASSAASP